MKGFAFLKLLTGMNAKYYAHASNYFFISIINIITYYKLLCFCPEFWLCIMPGQLK